MSTKPSHISERIFTIRGQRVMISTHLAELYDVQAKVLVQAVKRNIERFPGDFMFPLSADEDQSLRSQFVTLEPGRGQHPKYPAYAFTEQGVAMLSSVLRSGRAVQVNIAIMRAFVQMRELASSHRDITAKLDSLEKKYDSQFRVVFDAIRQLMKPAIPGARRPIGFLPAGKKRNPPAA